MKKLYGAILFAGFLSGTSAWSQTLTVEERIVKNEESNDMDSWTARLDQDVDYCMGTYSDFIKDLVKIKVDKRGKTMLVAEKALFPELSTLRIDQRAIFTAESGGTAVSFTFSPGYDVHFGQQLYKAEYAKGEAFVKNYVRYHYKTYYEAQIKTLTSKINSLQSDIESNGKKIDKNNKSIASNKSDGETEKTASKNEKMGRENVSYAADTDAKRKQISDLEDQLAKANESLQKVLGYK